MWGSAQWGDAAMRAQRGLAQQLPIEQARRAGARRAVLQHQHGAPLRIARAACRLACTLLRALLGRALLQRLMHTTAKMTPLWLAKSGMGWQGPWKVLMRPFAEHAAYRRS